MNLKTGIAAIAATIAIGAAQVADACTNFLITKSVSGGCGNMITYAADSHQLYGCLYHYAGAINGANSTRDIYDWDSGQYRGRIPEAACTYNVVGNINEHQLSIAETTYGGLPILEEQDGAIIDYGSLIYIALQRCRTAREAIRLMAEITDQYGYASEGESFSIADPNEVWIMEVIGRGNFGKGMVWVARRVPDGYISAHANQARITTFQYQKTNKWDDPKADTFNSYDVIQFAKDHDLYSGKDKDFSFSDVYNPVDFEGARFCDIRVWAFFASAAPKTFGSNADYWNYAKGDVRRNSPYQKGMCQTKENFPTNRLPLWIKPENYVTVHDAMNEMRNHLEGTELDMSKDLGAGPFGCPYRMRPLTWESNGQTYLNERVTATQQTGFVFVSQLRDWLPNDMGGIIWFGTDDAASTVFAPFYCCITQVPEEYREGNGSLTRWSNNSSFWLNNMIANFAYTRYSLIHPEIEKVQQEQEEYFISRTKEIEKEASGKSDNERVRYLTEYSCTTASKLFESRKELFGYLFMKYMDGNEKATDSDGNFITNGHSPDIPKVEHRGYGQKWQDDVARETGDKLKCKE